jgi:predicted enzyme related to lactoylglutathione lyase
MTLNLNGIMLGSEDPKRLADFYTTVLGAPDSEWSDVANGWFAFAAGTGGLVVGPHSEVTGKNQHPGRIMFNLATSDVDGEFERIKGSGAEVVAQPYSPGEGMQMCTFADPDGNYFQLTTQWDSETAAASASA